MRPRCKILVLAFWLLSTTCFSCEWVRGYFHQVTAIRGHVVGKSLGPVQWRWLRQSFNVRGAELTLYTYSDAYSPPDKQPESIARTRADENGWFDFGETPKGHYTLVVRAGDLSDWFDVEVTPAAQNTDYVKIDVSPNRPDCSGGHEFIVRTKS
jgi:hypothetical protein